MLDDQLLVDAVAGLDQQNFLSLSHLWRVLGTLAVIILGGLSGKP
jgi:hypothetical protein